MYSFIYIFIFIATITKTMLLISRSSRFSSDWHWMQQQKIWNGSLFACCGLEASLLVDKTSSRIRTGKCFKIWLVSSNADFCVTFCCYGLFEAIHLCWTRIRSADYTAGDSFLPFSVNIETMNHVKHLTMMTIILS